MRNFKKIFELTNLFESAQKKPLLRTLKASEVSAFSLVSMDDAGVLVPEQEGTTVVNKNNFIYPEYMTTPETLSMEYALMQFRDFTRPVIGVRNKILDFTIDQFFTLQEYV